MYTLQDKNRLDILSVIFGLRRYLMICGWGDYYSKELIEEGVNLVITATNFEKASQVAEELKSAYTFDSKSKSVSGFYFPSNSSFCN